MSDYVRDSMTGVGLVLNLSLSTMLDIVFQMT